MLLGGVTTHGGSHHLVTSQCSHYTLGQHLRDAAAGLKNAEKRQGGPLYTYTCTLYYIMYIYIYIYVLLAQSDSGPSASPLKSLQSPGWPHSSLEGTKIIRIFKGRLFRGPLIISSCVLT